MKQRENRMKEGIYYIGASDTEIDLFENQYPVPEGMAYNSYVIIDEKTAVMDTVDARVTEKWQKRLTETLGDRKPDYLVVQHLEPDHSANIGWFAEKWPEATIVLTAKAAQMLPQFFADIKFKTQTVKEGDTLNLGKHTLQFIMAPMVHWPEVMMSYEQTTHSLFSADAFGEFGATTENGEDDDDWTPGARRYYYNIVGKYGVQVQGVLKKAAALKIETIYPLHGPILRENIGEYVGHYANWSSWKAEQKGIVVAVASIHGNTAKAAETIVEKLKAQGVESKLIDLTRTEVSYAVAEAMDHEGLIVAASSYDAGLFPPMENFLLHLKAKSYQNREVGIVENGSWAPTAGKIMRGILESMKGIEIVEPMVTIKTKPNEAAWAQTEEMIKALTGKK